MQTERRSAYISLGVSPQAGSIKRAVGLLGTYWMGGPSAKKTRTGTRTRTKKKKKKTENGARLSRPPPSSSFFALGPPLHKLAFPLSRRYCGEATFIETGDWSFCECNVTYNNNNVPVRHNASLAVTNPSSNFVGARGLWEWRLKNKTWP